MIFSLGERHVETEDIYYVAENATVIGSVILGSNASVWFNAVVRGDNDRITIGEYSNIQDASVLHVDEGVPCNVGARVSVGHQAMLHGCTIGDGSLIGISAVVLNHARIGRNCLIGANSLIPEGKEIPEGSLVVGSPGRVVRSLSQDEISAMGANARHYAEKAELYRTSLRRRD